MGAHVAMVSWVVIIAIGVLGAVCILFIIVHDFHVWDLIIIGSSSFIFISGISVETSIIVCGAEFVIGVNYMPMLSVGERECN